MLVLGRMVSSHFLNETSLSFLCGKNIALTDVPQELIVKLRARHLMVCGQVEVVVWLMMSGG